jgi:hypothetical protein
MTYKKYITIIFLLLKSLSFGKTQLLKKYDFDKGGYSLLGIRTGAAPNDLAEKLGDFYTNDIAVLNAIKKEWTFKKSGVGFACGYHYEVIICENGFELERFSINLNCKEISCDEGYFYFDPEQLAMFQNNFNYSYRKKEEFNSLSEARNYYTEIRKKPNLIYAPTPAWTTYEGTFDFTLSCEYETKDCYQNEKKLLGNLTEEISKKYPGEEFELESIGGSLTDLFVKVTCNKSLAEKFTLYSKNGKFAEWKAFDLRFYTFW